MSLSVQELKYHYIDSIIQYFLNADPSFLVKMGVDEKKLPNSEQWRKSISSEMQKSLSEKTIYYLIWFKDEKAIGHSNINNIKFGESAFMHLHIWKEENRKAGYGQKLIKMSIQTYFEKFKLKELFCQPKSNNSAPNELLKTLGFEYIKSYICIPGSINFEQEVNLYRLSKEK